MKNFILNIFIIDPEQLAVDALNTSDLAKQMPNVSDIIR